MPKKGKEIFVRHYVFCQHTFLFLDAYFCTASCVRCTLCSNTNASISSADSFLYCIPLISLGRPSRREFDEKDGEESGRACRCCETRTIGNRHTSFRCLHSLVEGTGQAAEPLRRGPFSTVFVLVRGILGPSNDNRLTDFEDIKVFLLSEP